MERLREDHIRDRVATHPTKWRPTCPLCDIVALLAEVDSLRAEVKRLTAAAAGAPSPDPRRFVDVDAALDEASDQFIDEKVNGAPSPDPQPEAASDEGPG